MKRKSANKKIEMTRNNYSKKKDILFIISKPRVPAKLVWPGLSWLPNALDIS